MPNPPSARDDSSFAKEVQAMIRVQEATSLTGSVGRLLLGAGACLLMGFIATTVITSCLYVLFGNTYLGWSGWFAAYLFVLVPLLIWQERKSRQDYLIDSMRSIDPNPSSHGEYEMNRAEIQVALYAAWLVWGPRALIDGIRGMRGMRTSTQHAVLDRAAALVVRLSKIVGGVEIKQLVQPPEDMGIFGDAVDLLDKHGWIGKSSDGRSLWLNSTFRDKLISQTRRG